MSDSPERTERQSLSQDIPKQRRYFYVTVSVNTTFDYGIGLPASYLAAMKHIPLRPSLMAVARSSSSWRSNVQTVNDWPETKTRDGPKRKAAVAGHRRNGVELS